MSFKNISVRLTADASSLKRELLTAAREVDAFGKRVEVAGAGAASSSKVFSAAAKGVGVAAVAVAAGLATGVKQAAEFETRMRNVNSISGLSEKALSALGDEVLNLSRALPQSANVLAEGLYEVASSGFQGAQGLKVLEAAAKAASAGLTTTAVSSKAITAVLNAYGLGAEQATDVSDTLFQTVNLGVVSFEELSSVIGDTLGTAAAAKVPIEQVGAAIATMTLAGISGAESATSLNRLLQELIDPSEALTLVLHQLGYESGAQALEVDGLHVVMERLRQATGGNIESLLQLFPEIRAARGALALMSKEGENYNRVSAGIDDANARQGATQRALTEQMKALGAQWTLFRNRANAAAIELGTRLIPVVLDTVTAVQRLGASAVPTLQHAMAALAPFFRNVVEVGGDLADVARDVAASLAPLAKIVAGITAGGVIAALNALSTVLGTITGFLADHPGLVTAVAVAYGVKLAAGLASAAVGFAAIGIERVGTQLGFAALGADRAAKSFLSLGAAAKGIGFGLVVGELTAIANGLANADRQAKELVGEITKTVDPTVLRSIEDAAKDVGVELDRVAKSPDESGAGRLLRLGKGMLELATPMKNVELDAGRAGKALAAVQEDLNRQLVHYAENQAVVRNATGLSAGAVGRLARKLKVDLTGSFGESTGERGKLIDYIRDLAFESGITGDALANATEIDIEKMTALASSIEEVKKKVNDVFTSSTDFIAAFKPDAEAVSTKAVKEARDDLAAAKEALESFASRGGEKTRQDVSDQQALRKARERVAAAGTKGTGELAAATQALADVEERQAAGARSDADDQRALAKARERVAEATDKVRDAQSKVTTQGGQIRTFYEDQIRLTSKFATDLTAAAAKGLDPEVLKRLLTAGPEQAAPILDALLADHSGGLIRMVNESEQKLREINTRVVEFARLTQKAVSSETDTMARDLGTAMKIAAANMEQGAAATVASIASAIGVPQEDVRRLAADYGITLAAELVNNFDQGVKAGMDAATARLKEQFDRLRTDANAVGPSLFGPVGVPAAVSATNAAAADPYTGRILSGTFRPRLHSGGLITGWGDVPIMAQSGEFVMRRSAVAALGLDRLHRLNRYHDGGHVTMPSVSAATAAAIDYDRLAAAIAKASPAPTTIDARSHVEIKGGEAPTQAELDYASRRQAMRLSAVVRR